jgi:hypothetical protein
MELAEETKEEQMKIENFLLCPMPLIHLSFVWLKLRSKALPRARLKGLRYRSIDFFERRKTYMYCTISLLLST